MLEKHETCSCDVLVWKYLQHVFPPPALSLPLRGSLCRSCRCRWTQRRLGWNPPHAALRLRERSSAPTERAVTAFGPGKKRRFEPSFHHDLGLWKERGGGCVCVMLRRRSGRVLGAGGARQGGFLRARWRDAGSGSGSPNRGLDSSDRAS